MHKLLNKLDWVWPPLILCVALLLVILFLSGCQTQIAGTEPINPLSGCTAFARITFDRLKDTPETIIEIKSYDAARDKVCGAGK